MNTPTDMFEELREILPPFLRPTTDREDVAALAALSRWRNKARENAHAEAIRACAKATGRTFVPPERATDLDVVVDAIRSVEQDTAARVTAEMLALVCKAEQDERARLLTAVMAIPVVDLGAANYGEGTCTQWDEHVEEHLELDEDDREHSTYSMVCDGAERVRALVTKALAPDPVQVRAPDAPDAPLSVAPLWCPWCGLRHVDEGEFATRPHHTHRCVAVGGCGREWRLETYVSGAPVAGQCDWFGEEPAKAPALETADDVVTCGACGQSPCSCAPDCKCGRPSCGGQCEPE